MKCLSIRQPWAWAVMSGQKAVENRTWSTGYRGRLLIHAAKGRQEFTPASAPGYHGLIAGLPPIPDLAFGAVVGSVDLVDCLPIEDLPAALRGSPFAEGPICWVVRDPVRIEPVPLPGKLGLFDVDVAGMDPDLTEPR